MAVTVAEEVSESGPDSNNFTTRTLTFATPAAVGDRVVVLSELYTSSGVQTTAGMISDDGGHTWTQDVGQTGDGSTGGLAILSVAATAPINSITLTPGGSGNYATWGIYRLSGAAELDDAEVGNGTSTSPQPTTAMTATTNDGVALSIISTRGVASQTQPSTWTLDETETDNSSNLAGALAHSANISSSGTVPAVWTLASSVVWFFTGVIYKASAGGGATPSVARRFPMLGVA